MMQLRVQSIGRGRTAPLRGAQLEHRLASRTGQLRRRFVGCAIVFVLLNGIVYIFERLLLRYTCGNRFNGKFQVLHDHLCSRKCISLQRRSLLDFGLYDTICIFCLNFLQVGPLAQSPELRAHKDSPLGRGLD